jgi:hypothetical protein
MSEKKPDQVVYNEEEQKYNAGLLPYATNASAPKITSTDLTGWKNSNINKANHQIKTEYDKLKKAYEDLMKKHEYNALIYNAEFSFEPNVGQIYHLYIKENKQTFLSIIAPNECNFEYKGSFKLNDDKIWEKIHRTSNRS